MGRIYEEINVEGQSELLLGRNLIKLCMQQYMFQNLKFSGNSHHLTQLMPNSPAIPQIVKAGS